MEKLKEMFAQLGETLNNRLFLYTIGGVLGVVLIRRWRMYVWGTCPSTRLMKGKTVIITGANSGLGKATAFELARRGAKIILACRDMNKCLATASEIVDNVPEATLVPRELDLASLDSVKRFCQGVLHTEPHIDVLINNAGIFQCPYTLTKEGFEMQMGVNHLGHFLLTNLLLERLKTSGNLEDPSRIVIVSSKLYKRGLINFNDMFNHNNYNPKQAYANSKLANTLFARQLARKVEGQNVNVYCVSPGMVYTNLGRHIKIPWYLVMLLLPVALVIVRTPYQGCQTIVDCAVNEEYADQNGYLYRNCEPCEYEGPANDKLLAQQLWLASENLIGLKQSGEGSVDS